jgi:hypothetical protein
MFAARFLARELGLVFCTSTVDHKSAVHVKAPGSEYAHLLQGEGGMM